MSKSFISDPSPPTSRGQEVASGVCGSQTIKKNSKGAFEFSLSWDMPKIEFAAKENSYTRYCGGSHLQQIPENSFLPKSKLGSTVKLCVVTSYNES